MAFYTFVSSIVETGTSGKNKKDAIVFGGGWFLTIVFLIALVFDPTFIWNGYKWVQGQLGVSFGPLAFIGIVWAFLTYYFAFLKGLRYYKTTFDPLKRRQLKIVFWATIFSTLIDMFYAICWALNIKLPEQLITSFIGEVITYAIAIFRYEMFTVNVSTVAETIVGTMADGVFLLSNNLRIYTANSSSVKMLGVESKNIIGKNINEFIMLDGNFNFDDQVTDREALLIPPGKERLPISLSTAIIPDNMGESRGIVCIIRDIKERKIQEERLQESLEIIKVDVARLQVILESIGESLIVADDKNNIIMINNMCEELLGWKGENVLGLNLYSNFHIVNTKDDFLDIEGMVNDIKKTKGILHYSMTDYISVKIKNGKKIPITLTTAPVKLGPNHVGTITIFENMTKDMEVDKAKSEFVSLAAHQLSTPISSIKWNIELLRQEIGKKLTPAMFKILENSYREAENMSDLIDQFLNVSRIELGKLMVNPEMTNLGKIIGEIIKDQKSLYIAKKLKITEEISDEVPEISLDRVLIRIVIQNLISNAVKYTPKNGTVQVRLLKRDSYAELIVKDNGIGITKTQQKQIFSKMFRAKNAVDTGLEGNGLGLYISKSIVSLMDGEILFHSEVNKGTTFILQIPYTGMEKRAGLKMLIN